MFWPYFIYYRHLERKMTKLFISIDNQKLDRIYKAIIAIYRQGRKATAYLTKPRLYFSLILLTCHLIQHIMFKYISVNAFYNQSYVSYDCYLRCPLQQCGSQKYHSVVSNVLILGKSLRVVMDLFASSYLVLLHPSCWLVSVIQRDRTFDVSASRTSNGRHDLVPDRSIIKSQIQAWKLFYTFLSIFLSKNILKPHTHKHWNFAQYFLSDQHYGSDISNISI